MTELELKQIEERLLASYEASPVQDSRFGMIPTGTFKVFLIDRKALTSSINCKLSDEGKLCNFTAKDPARAPKAFEQDIVVLVFQDEEGRVVFERRHFKGWLTDSETDENGNLKVTHEFMTKHGLKPVTVHESSKPTVRYITKSGKGAESATKTKSCIEMNDRICSYFDVKHPLLIPIGASIMVDVVRTKNDDGKFTSVVTKWHNPKDDVSTTANAPANAIAQPAITAPEDDEVF
jgi:hypothetical protein